MMDTIRKILVPLAFTEYSQGVFDCAAGIAMTYGADLIVISVINSRDIESVERIVSMGYEVDADHYVEDVRRDRKQKLKAMASQSEIDTNRVKVLFKVGKPVDEILKVILKESPDLVVMGTRGRSSLESSVMGSVAEKIFKNSPVNVLSYRDDDVRQRLLKRIHV